MSTHILVVEDSPTQAAALRALLEGEGYEVTVACTGEDGLRRSTASAFDAIISDVMMPGLMDGYELCRQIKAGPQRHTPVVLLTSLTDPLDIIRGLECGADNFLTKPYEPDHLLQRLKTLLGTRLNRGRTKLRLGVEVFFMGREFTITSDREQILDLLISTFEDAVRQNRELRRREEELETARGELARYAGGLNERLQHVLASTPAVIYELRLEGDKRIPVWISANVHRLTGFTSEAASAPSWWLDHIHPEDLARALSQMPTLASAGEVILEYRFRHLDGSYRWIRDQSRQVQDATGHAMDIVGAWVDITEERRLSEQVRMAQRMEAVGTLASGVAHDFNNVLTVIRGTADLTQAEPGLSMAVRESMVEISEAVDRAAALTHQLLAFGRRQVLQPRPLDFNDLTSGTMKMLRRIIGEDIRITELNPSEPLIINADPGQIEQVLMNLAVNARDAMPDGGEMAIISERVTIDEEFCATHPWAVPGEYVRLTVSDTGIGMDAATQARIFEPFFTTKELGRGTGLGLAVVYGIVKQHGGLIHVYSELGKGTAFRVYFRLESDQPEERISGDVEELPRGTETILLVEDDASLRASTTKLLERLGYGVRAVATGEEAVKIMSLPQGGVSLALVDVVMPGMGGHEVFERIHGSNPKLPFIFSTGYSPGTAQTEAIRALPAPVLPKPYGIQALARAVRSALDTGR